MEDVEASASGEATSGEDSNPDDDQNITADTIPSILRITISPDGQWLATSDDRRHTHIFNLDSISVRSQYSLSCFLF
jgi:U3 small nucleolar RNA-associated protein 4